MLKCPRVCSLGLGSASDRGEAHFLVWVLSLEWREAALKARAGLFAGSRAREGFLVFGGLTAARAAASCVCHTLRAPPATGLTPSCSQLGKDRQTDTHVSSQLCHSTNVQ